MDGLYVEYRCCLQAIVIVWFAISVSCLEKGLVGISAV